MTSSLAEIPVVGASIPRMELVDWWDRFGLVAGITTRGETHAPCDLRLEPDHHVEVSGAWREFWTGCRNQFRSVVVGRQVHGSEILRHEDGSGIRVYPGVDGHVTNERGCLLAVTVADCIPIYLVAQDTNTVALLHAGWRGVAAGILERGVRILAATGTAPADMVLHLGVGVCGSCYEVGPEVPEQLGLARPEGPVMLDLREILAGRANQLGVGEVTTSPACSRHDQAYHSYRRDGAKSGRMAAYLGVPLG